MAAINKVILFGRLLERPELVTIDQGDVPARCRVIFTSLDSDPSSGPVRLLVQLEKPDLVSRLIHSRPGDFVYLDGQLTDGGPPVPFAACLSVDDVLAVPGVSEDGVGQGASARGGYSGAIRWQAFQDPRWELETRHPGFASAEDAALFTTGFGRAGVDELELSAQGLSLSLTDGSVTRVEDADVRIWHAPVPREGFRPECATFLHVPVGVRQLAQLVAPTQFVPLLYDVVGPHEERIPFSIRSGGANTLQLTVYDPVTTSTDSKTPN